MTTHPTAVLFKGRVAKKKKIQTSTSLWSDAGGFLLHQQLSAEKKTTKKTAIVLTKKSRKWFIESWNQTALCSHDTKTGFLHRFGLLMEFITALYHNEQGALI